MTTEHGAGMGLRERKKQQTRDALSLAAIRLTVERGWAGVTVDDIAAAANVSVRTFRNYFSSKAEAIASRHTDRMRRIARELRIRPGEEPLGTAISTAVQAQFLPEHDIEHRAVHDRQQADGIRLMLTEPALQGEIARANAAAQSELAEAIGERTVTDPTREMYPKLVAAAVGAAIDVAIEHCLYPDQQVPLGPVLRDALDQLSTGLPVQ